MLITTKEQFEQAILANQEIKTQTVFYTGELEEETNQAPIGSLYSGGIVAGYYNGRPLVLSLKDAPKEMNWNDAMKYGGDKYRLPTRIEWLIMLENKDVINKALIENVGDELEDGWYWSSSERSYGSAWLVGTVGNVDWYYKYYYNYYVRCVLAF